MKILYIADSTSVHTQRWLEYFLEAGHDINIITIGKKTEKIKGVKHLANFEQFYYGSISCLKIICQTRKIIRDLKPQILHAHFVEQYGWLAALSGFHPFFLTAWGTDILHLPYVSRSKIGRRLTQYALRKADTLTAISTHLKQEMVKLGAEPNYIYVVFCGVDTKKFHPGVDVTNLRKALAINNFQPVVLSNRNQVALYNNDIVIKSMAKVLKVTPNAVLILQNAGGGLENELKQLVRENGIENSVRFLPQMDYEEMPAIYGLSDIFVSVPSWDAGPVSLKEAMASGAVPIISEIPGPMEWVKNDINGKVVPVKNVGTLANAIIDLLNNENKRREYSRENRKLIKKKGEHMNLMKKIESLYRSAIT